MPEFITLNPIACIGWIIVGAIAGALARQLTGSRDEPFINDLVLGLLGSVIGGLVAGFLGFGGNESGGIERVIINLIIAVIGAVIIIALGRMLRGR
jgi:uncharacterized membrane protein YeaQ/YmgE (transglycosylase-associated protein family)